MMYSTLTNLLLVFLNYLGDPANAGLFGRIMPEKKNTVFFFTFFKSLIH